MTLGYIKLSVSHRQDTSGFMMTYCAGCIKVTACCAHHQGGVPRPNGGPGAGGRLMVGRRYNLLPMDDSAYHQQQAVFGNQAHQPSHHHQPPPAHVHQPQPHEQQHFLPMPPRQDYWIAHPDGTYIWQTCCDIIWLPRNRVVE